MAISKEKIRDTCGNGSTYRAVHPYILTLGNNDFNFASPYQTLRRFAASPLGSIHKTSDIRQRELMASALVEIQGTEIVPKVKNNSHIAGQCCDMQLEIRKLSSAESDDKAGDVYYYTRMAELASALGNHAFAEQMRVSADSRQYADATVIENLNLLFTEISVMLLQLERLENDDSDLKDELLMWAYMGLDIIELSDTARLTAWRKLFILQIVSCLLGIGSVGTIYSNNINTEALQEAKDLLAQLDSLMHDSSTKRQEILYYVAKSRQSECSGDTELAKIYISKAKQVECQDASVREMGKHVQEYELKILERFHRKNGGGYRYRTNSDENAVVARQANSFGCESPWKEKMDIPYCTKRKPADELICAVMPQQLFMTSQTMLRDGQNRTEQTHGSSLREHRIPLPSETCMSQNLAHLQSPSTTEREMHRTERNNRSVAINVTFSQNNEVEYSFRATETQHCLQILKPQEMESLRKESEENLISPCDSLETNVHTGNDLGTLSDFHGAAPVIDRLKCDEDTVSGGRYSLDNPSCMDSFRNEDSPKLRPLEILTVNGEQTKITGQKLNPLCRSNTQCKSYGLEGETLGQSCSKQKQSDRKSEPKSVKSNEKLCENFQRISVKAVFVTHGTNACSEACLTENKSFIKGLSNNNNLPNSTFSAEKLNMRFECTDDELFGSGTENNGSSMMNVKETLDDNFFPDILLSSRGEPDGASCE